MNDEIIKLAKECGFDTFGSDWYDNRLEAFYRAAFNAGLEAADNVVYAAITNGDTAVEMLDEIRALEMKP